MHTIVIGIRNVDITKYRCVSGSVRLQNIGRPEFGAAIELRLRL